MTRSIDLSTTPPQERRLGGRFPLAIDVALQGPSGVLPSRTVDVSRHGLFVACQRPELLPPSVLITVKLRSGPFDTVANVVRRVENVGGGPIGAGLKLFCLGSEAKDRWDRLVVSLETPGLELPTRLAPKVAACFLVHPEDPAALLNFFNQNVLVSRILYVSPAVRLIGAEVDFVLVHPQTHEEHVARASVVEWNPDHPKRMGVRFDPIDSGGRRAFLKFLGAPPQEPMAGGDRDRVGEYAFFSPKLAAKAETELLLEDEVVDDREQFDFTWNNKPED